MSARPDRSALETLGARFRAAHGRAAQVAARAPGRVNLIGEHTDYNEGLVLPCAVDRDLLALAAARDDGRFACISREEPGPVRFERGDPAPEGFGAYVHGVVQALALHGHAVPGADLAVASDVPVGAGLSSSAALCVALVCALDAAFELELAPRARAEIAWTAESRFVGVPIGRMDQLASALGRRDHALAIDCRSLEVEPVPLPAARLALLVADSGVRRRLVHGDYADRRAECREALRLARQSGIAPQARALRDLELGDLPRLERALPPQLARRVRHVLHENERVGESASALASGDLERVGALLRDGMRSLRDDFEVSIPELDALCALGDALPGVYGSRLTGAGFGGCTLHLVRADAAAPVGEALADAFGARFGRRPPIHRVSAADGAAPIPL